MNTKKIKNALLVVVAFLLLPLALYSKANDTKDYEREDFNMCRKCKYDVIVMASGVGYIPNTTGGGETLFGFDFTSLSPAKRLSKAGDYVLVNAFFNITPSTDNFKYAYISLNGTSPNAGISTPNELSPDPGSTLVKLEMKIGINPENGYVTYVGSLKSNNPIYETPEKVLQTGGTGGTTLDTIDIRSIVSGGQDTPEPEEIGLVSYDITLFKLR